jgi:hypothetical protein
MSVGPDDNWLCSQYLGKAGGPGRTTRMQRFTYKYQIVPYNVLQLLCTFFLVLPDSILWEWEKSQGWNSKWNVISA